MTYPVLKEPQTLVERIIESYATRTTDEFDATGAMHRRLRSMNQLNPQKDQHLQLITQRRVGLDLHLTTADVKVRLLRSVERARRDGPVLGAPIHRR